MTKTAILSTIVLVGLPALASYDPSGLTRGQEKCEQSVSKAMGKTWASIARCQAKCDAGAQVGSNPASDCLGPPWGTGKTQACVSKAKAKGVRVIDKGCAGGCPACYDAGGNCDASAGFGVWVAQEVNMQRPVDAAEAQEYLHWIYGIACDDPSLQPAEAACRETVEAAGGKLFAADMKCLAKCRHLQFKGALPLSPNPCLPFVGIDQRTTACFGKANSKFLAACNASCSDPPDCPGHCVGGSQSGNPCTSTVDCPGGGCAGPFPSCDSFADDFLEQVLGFDASTTSLDRNLLFCPASASGAFVD
jgi:hypothetical protein